MGTFKVEFNTSRNELCISHELDKYWYNLESSTIFECISGFLKASGIQDCEVNRVLKINDSVEQLEKSNENLKELLGSSLELIGKMNVQNELMRKYILNTSK